jgi:hypothetical protein
MGTATPTAGPVPSGGAAASGYRAADPSAYGGQATVRRRDVARTAGIQAALLIVLVPWHGALALTAVGLLTLLNLRLAPWPWARRGSAPLVVDRPGVFVGGSGEPGRLVHWESVHAIVLCEATSRRNGHRRPVPGVGLRLRSHPDVVAIRRPLDGWRIDEGQLLAAVTRFAPPGVAVVREGPLGEVFTLRPATVDVARRVAGAAAQAAVTRTPLARTPLGRAVVRGLRGTDDPEPAPGPAEFVVRGASGPGGTSGPGEPGAPGAPGELRLSVDGTGVYLGAVRRRDVVSPGRLVPWADIGAVVVFDVQERSGWHRAVGVTAAARGAAPPASARDLVGYRVAHDWPVDRARLEAAVALHAPRVPVLDGPPLRRTELSDVVSALARARREGELRLRRRR